MHLSVLSILSGLDVSKVEFARKQTSNFSVTAFESITVGKRHWEEKIISLDYFVSFP